MFYTRSVEPFTSVALPVYGVHQLYLYQKTIEKTFQCRQQIIPHDNYKHTHVALMNFLLANKLNILTLQTIKSQYKLKTI